MILQNISIHFLVCKGRSNDDGRVARETVSKEIHLGAGFKPGDFVREIMGGYTVERVPRSMHRLGHEGPMSSNISLA